MNRITTIFAGAAAAGAVAALAPNAAAQLPPLDATTYDLGYSDPLGFVQDPGDPSVQYVVQQGGLIRVIKDGETVAEPFISLTDRVSTNASERGLLGLAFPPDYATSGRFYVNYTNLSGDTHVSRFQRDASDPLKGDPDSEEILLVVDQPFSNHNGGHLIFGPDGYLYVGLGDGGSAGDPGHRAQDEDTLLGKILRIDVSTSAGYAIPPDNPFVDDDPIDAREEIWHFGVRNPWRFFFDDPAMGGTGAMLLADVGQNVWEEIDFQPAGVGGLNFGWRNKEGFANFNNTLPPAYEPLIDPIHVYSHGVGRSITGGYVYRGDKLGADFRGRYFWADFVFGKVWSADLTIDGSGNADLVDVVEHTDEFGGSGVIGNVSSFGVDAEGELYFTSFNGRIFRIERADLVNEMTDVEVVRGTLLGGGLPEIAESDDQFLAVRSQIGFSAFEPNVTEVVFESQTNVDTPIRIDVVVEAKNDHPFGDARLGLFDFDAQAFDQIAAYDISSTESTRVVTIEEGEDPGRFVRDADGVVRTRSVHTVVATFTALGFVSRYDFVTVDVY